MQQTKLETLLITEVSGVDDPANELPGWMVTKARRGDDLLTTVKAIIFRPRNLSDVSEESIEKAAETFGYAAVLIADGSVEVVEKAGSRAGHPGGSHRDPATGKFHPTTLNGWSLAGAIHPTLGRLAAQRRAS